MSAYHLSLLGLAGIGALACLANTPGQRRSAALLSLAAMALAMSGGLAGLMLGIAGMLVLIPATSQGTAGWLRVFRVASPVTMAAVLCAMFMLNGAGFCGTQALPLLTPSGLPFIMMSPAVLLAIHAAVVLMALYACVGLGLGLHAVRIRCPGMLVELIPMTLATLGMGVGLA